MVEHISFLVPDTALHRYLAEDGADRLRSALAPSITNRIPCSGSSSLSYDAVTDQYVYVWKTDKAWANTCRQLIVQLNDGTAHVAYFKFTK